MRCPVAVYVQLLQATHVMYTSIPTETEHASWIVTFRSATSLHSKIHIWISPRDQREHAACCNCQFKGKIGDMRMPMPICDGDKDKDKDNDKSKSKLKLNRTRTRT